MLGVRLEAVLRRAASVLPEIENPHAGTGPTYLRLQAADTADRAGKLQEFEVRQLVG